MSISTLFTVLYYTDYFFTNSFAGLLFDSTFLIRVSTILGSASVEMSPKESVSPETIFRRMRLMIFPLRVMGREGEMTIMSGEQKAPTSFRTLTRSSVSNSGDSSKPCFNMQKAQIAWPLRSWGLPTTAACATAG